MTLLPEIQEIVKLNIEKISWSSTLARGLYDPIDYVMSLGGKRIRPSLLLMSADAFGANPRDFVNQALAIEVFHNFTLLHDDVMDNAPVRRGKPTVHVKWSESTATLSGDAMLIKAYELLADGIPDDKLPSVLALFSRTAREVCEGQQLDMEFESRNDVTEGEYLEMIRLKTSVLLGCACKMGALIGGADEATAQLFYKVGENLGLAFQLQDDMLDVWGDEATFGKAIGGDIMNNKKTFLLINAMQRATGDHKVELSLWLSTPNASRAVKVPAVTAIYDALNLRSLSLDAINRYNDEALEALSKIAISDEARSEFANFITRLVKRDK